MPSMSQRLQAAAFELLERMRVGLDIPSRSEVLALAERLEAIGRQMTELEQKRAGDAATISRLRDEAARVAEAAEKKAAKKKEASEEKARKKAAKKKEASEEKAKKKAAKKSDANAMKAKARASGATSKISTANDSPEGASARTNASKPKTASKTRTSKTLAGASKTTEPAKTGAAYKTKGTSKKSRLLANPGVEARPKKAAAKTGASASPKPPNAKKAK